MLLNARYTDCPSAKHHERSDVTTGIQLANALEIERLVETNQVEQVVSTGDERKDRTVYQIVTWTADGQMSWHHGMLYLTGLFYANANPSLQSVPSKTENDNRQ